MWEEKSLRNGQRRATKLWREFVPTCFFAFDGPGNLTNMERSFENRDKYIVHLVGGWTTQLKNMLVKLDHFPKSGVKLKNTVFETTTCFMNRVLYSNLIKYACSMHVRAPDISKPITARTSPDDLSGAFFLSHVLVTGKWGICIFTCPPASIQHIQPICLTFAVLGWIRFRMQLHPTSSPHIST